MLYRHITACHILAITDLWTILQEEATGIGSDWRRVSVVGILSVWVSLWEAVWFCGSDTGKDVAGWTDGEVGRSLVLERRLWRVLSWSASVDSCECVFICSVYYIHDTHTHTHNFHPPTHIHTYTHTSFPMALVLLAMCPDAFPL